MVEEFINGILALVAIIIVCIVSLRLYQVSMKSELKDQTATYQREHDLKSLQHKQEIDFINRRVADLKYKLKQAKLGEYDLDIEPREWDNDESEETKLSDLATSIYPQLPGKLAKLLDREDIQDLLVNAAEKHPDKISRFIESFTKSTPGKEKTEQQTYQGI